MFERLDKEGLPYILEDDESAFDRLRLFELREGPSLSADIYTCLEENGYDDMDIELLESGMWSEATTIDSGNLPEILKLKARNVLHLGFFKIALPGFVPETLWWSGIPTSDELQDTQKIKTILRYQKCRSMSDDICKAINEAENFGHD